MLPLLKKLGWARRPSRGKNILCGFLSVNLFGLYDPGPTEENDWSLSSKGPDLLLNELLACQFMTILGDWVISPEMLYEPGPTLAGSSSNLLILQNSCWTWIVLWSEFTGSIIGVKNLFGILGIGIFRRPGLTAAARKRGEGFLLSGGANTEPETFRPCFAKSETNASYWPGPGISVEGSILGRFCLLKLI
jgi:hypothetical protein